MNETRAEWLGSVPLLAALPPDRLQHLADHCTARPVRRGHMLDLALERRCLFLVQQGRIALTAPDDPGRIFAVLADGDAFNEASLFDVQPVYGVRALEDVVVVALPPVFLGAHGDRITELAATLLAERTRSLVTLASELQSLDATTRIASRLCELAERHARQDGDMLALPRSFSHDMIASCVGATRETVTRALSTFRANGWLRSVDGRPVITDLPGLRARAAATVP